jgi:DnaK suppressor protein
MRKEKILKLQDILAGKIQTMREHVKRSTNELKEDRYPFADFYDQASYEAERDLDLSIQERERASLHNMLGALERIDQGVFGICELCGRHISDKRLMANPVTTFCIQCVARIEKKSTC